MSDEEHKPQHNLAEYDAHPSEGIRIDPQQVITPEQVLRVISEAPAKIKQTEYVGNSAPFIAEQLITTAYHSMNKTIDVYAMAQLQSQGIYKPTISELESVVTTTRIENSDFIHTLSLAYEYFSEAEPSVHSLSALIKFLEEEIVLLQGAESGRYNSKEIASALANLRQIKQHFQSRYQSEMGEQEDPTKHREHRSESGKSRGKPRQVTKHDYQNPNSWE